MFGFGKKKFDISVLEPTGGKISGMFFSNPNVGIETTLFHQIEIVLSPFEYGGKTEETSIQLDFITLPIKSYIELENSDFAFPTNPQKGYIDGSIYISGMHNPFDITNINFGKISNNEISASFKARLLFEDNSIKQTDIFIETKLKFGNIEIHCDQMDDMPENKILDYVETKIDLNNFKFDKNNSIFSWKK